jgi:hypothetical protein
VSVRARELRELETRTARRRGARPLLAVGAGGAAGAAAAFGFVRWAGLPEARAAWLVVALMAAAMVVMGAPFRMFWRPNASLLGRLPIDGRELYRLETWRSLRLALRLAVALALASLPLIPDARLLLLGCGFLFCAAVAAAPVGTAAGSLVVSAKAQALIQEMTSGQAAPGVIWLSLLPAAGGLAVAWAGWLAAHATGSGAPARLGATATVCAIAWQAGEILARKTLAAATREVAALDAVKLAHVDLSRARGLERLWGRLAAGPAREIYEKDVALLRRRHPGFYLLTGLAILALWIVAAAAPAPARDQVALFGVAALCAYVVVLARRMVVAPTEPPRLLVTLPPPPAAAARAKRAYIVWRALWATVVPGVPAVARSPRPLLLATWLALFALAAIVAGSAAIRPPRPSPSA